MGTKRKLSTWAKILCAAASALAMVPAESWARRPADTLALPTVYVPRAATPPKIDGRLHDRSWAAAPRLILKDNQNGRRSAQRTTVKVLRDDRHLYVAFDCVDTQVSAALTQRDDNLWREEVVEIFFDPTGEGKRYLEIEVNPIETLFDAWIVFGPDIDFDRAKKFDMADIRVATHIRRQGVDNPKDRGWSCEIAIPLGELPDAVRDGARINFARIDRINGVHVYDAWSPTLRWFHVPDRFGFIRFR